MAAEVVGGAVFGGVTLGTFFGPYAAIPGMIAGGYLARIISKRFRANYR